MHIPEIKQLSDFDDLSMNDLVVWHNSVCTSKEKVKSFRDKTTGRKRCCAVFVREQEHKEFEEETKDMTDEEFQAHVLKELNSDPAPSPRNKSSLPERNYSDIVLRKNGPGVRESWKDPELHKRRTTRNRVFVEWEGQRREFRSVREAFEEIGLPMKSHIRFRGKLKLKGELSFFFEEKEYQFEVKQRDS